MKKMMMLVAVALGLAATIAAEIPMPGCNGGSDPNCRNNGTLRVR